MKDSHDHHTADLFLPLPICPVCFRPINRVSSGRTFKFCSNACKQALYRLKKNDYQRQRISRRQREITAAVLAEQRQNSALALRNARATMANPSLINERFL